MRTNFEGDPATRGRRSRISSTAWCSVLVLRSLSRLDGPYTWRTQEQPFPEPWSG